MKRLDGHSAVLYGGDETALTDHVVLFAQEYLAATFPVVIVATQAHRNAFLTGLQAAGADTDAAIATGQLVCVDAIALLEELLRDGRVDWNAFEHNVSERVRSLRMRGPLRIYGEMVGVLWAFGRHELAIELETHWNRLRSRVDFDLLCAYDIDVLGADFLENEISGIVQTHDCVLSRGGPSAA